MAEFREGDRIYHQDRPYEVVTIELIQVDGGMTILSGRNEAGKRRAYYANQCKLVQGNPEGSLITW